MLANIISLSFASPYVTLSYAGECDYIIDWISKKECQVDGIEYTTSIHGMPNPLHLTVCKGSNCTEIVTSYKSYTGCFPVECIYCYDNFVYNRCTSTGFYAFSNTIGVILLILTIWLVSTICMPIFYVVKESALLTYRSGLFLRSAILYMTVKQTTACSPYVQGIAQIPIWTGNNRSATYKVGEGCVVMGSEVIVSSMPSVTPSSSPSGTPSPTPSSTPSSYPPWPDNGCMFPTDIPPCFMERGAFMYDFPEVVTSTTAVNGIFIMCFDSTTFMSLAQHSYNFAYGYDTTVVYNEINGNSDLHTWDDTYKNEPELEWTINSDGSLSSFPSPGVYNVYAHHGYIGDTYGQNCHTKSQVGLTYSNPNYASAYDLPDTEFYDELCIYDTTGQNIYSQRFALSVGLTASFNPPGKPYKVTVTVPPDSSAPTVIGGLTDLEYITLMQGYTGNFNYDRVNIYSGIISDTMNLNRQAGCSIDNTIRENVMSLYECGDVFTYGILHDIFRTTHTSYFGWDIKFAADDVYNPSRYNDDVRFCGLPIDTGNIARSCYPNNDANWGSGRSGNYYYGVMFPPNYCPNIYRLVSDAFTGYPQPNWAYWGVARINECQVIYINAASQSCADLYPNTIEYVSCLLIAAQGWTCFQMLQQPTPNLWSVNDLTYLKCLIAASYTIDLPNIIQPPGCAPWSWSAPDGRFAPTQFRPNDCGMQSLFSSLYQPNFKVTMNDNLPPDVYSAILKCFTTCYTDNGFVPGDAGNNFVGPGYYDMLDKDILRPIYTEGFINTFDNSNQNPSTCAFMTNTPFTVDYVPSCTLFPYNRIDKTESTWSQNTQFYHEIIYGSTYPSVGPWSDTAGPECYASEGKRVNTFFGEKNIQSYTLIQNRPVTESGGLIYQYNNDGSLASLLYVDTDPDDRIVTVTSPLGTMLTFVQPNFTCPIFLDCGRYVGSVEYGVELTIDVTMGDIFGGVVWLVSYQNGYNYTSKNESYSSYDGTTYGFMTVDIDVANEKTNVILNDLNGCNLYIQCLIVVNKTDTPEDSGTATVVIPKQPDNCNFFCTLSGVFFGSIKKFFDGLFSGIAGIGTIITALIYFVFFIIIVISIAACAGAFSDKRKTQ